jgi:2-desacetyl-2-hydroxyethyl bacteriochlorophyllide A dehydrogenase
MKAFRIYGARSARYEELPDPTIGPDEALLRVRAVAACGTDLEIYQGTMFYFTSGLAHYPVIPGHEWSGEVLQVGENVSNVVPGDKVVGECTVSCGYCDYCRRGWYNQCLNRQETGILDLAGGFADTMCYPASFLHTFERLSFEEAALCETTAISVYAVKLVETCPADRVAVLGSGPIGLQAMQAAKAYGAQQVVVIGGRASRRRLALELGADAVIDPRQQDLEQETHRVTDGEKFDVIIEATGNPVVTRDLLKIIRPRGRIALVGLFNGQKGEIDLDALVVNNITIKGSLGSPNVWDETLYLLETGAIQARPLITHRQPLSEALHVLQMMEERKPDLIKAVLVP